tara:strand:- start:4606 stop:5721 length:1116 start_codon:yes stop_codon:yes gene_type:complete
MRTFDTIEAYKPKTVNPNHHSPVSVAVRGALDSEYFTMGDRVPKLRPSSFPKCPVLDWMALYRYKKLGKIEERHSFSQDYFTGVGTVVHEIIQHHIGNTKQVYGNWKCINLKCKKGQEACTLRDATGKVVQEGKMTSFHTTDNLCPSCKRPMFYEELEISAMGSTGHVDCVLVIRDGKWWVVDYKTTLKRKVDSGELPESKHLYQLRAYAYILKFEYDLPIQGFSLVYLPRDNPFKFFEYSHSFDNKEEFAEAKKVLTTEKFKWDGAERANKTGKYEYAVERKPCKCTEDYYEVMDFYDPCPLLDICFKRKKLDSFLYKWKHLHKEKAVPVGVNPKEIVDVIMNRDYEDIRKEYGSSNSKRTRRKRKSSMA